MDAFDWPTAGRAAQVHLSHVREQVQARLQADQSPATRAPAQVALWSHALQVL